MVVEDVIEVLKRQVITYSSQKAVAERIGISPQYLSDILQKRRGLSWKVLSFLGMEKRVVYEYKG